MCDSNKSITLLIWGVSYRRILCEPHFLSTQRQNIHQLFPCSFLKRKHGNIVKKIWSLQFNLTVSWYLAFNWWIFAFTPCIKMSSCHLRCGWHAFARITCIFIIYPGNVNYEHNSKREWEEVLTCEDWGLFQLTGTKTLLELDPEEVEEVLRVTAVVLLFTSWPGERCRSS